MSSFLERARNAMMDDDDDLIVDVELGSALAQLITAWMNERHSPDLLVFQGELLDGLLQKLHEQTLMVQHLGSDPATTEEEHLRLTLVQIDMERLKFIIRSYLRIRLHKIEQFAPYIMQNPQIQTRLSVAELSVAERYQALLATHYHSSVLDALPDNTHQLDQTFGDGSSMISQFDKDQGVFVRVRVRCPDITLPDGVVIQLEPGAIHLLRYRTIEHLLSRGDVTLV